jgi:hypothetical protein
VIAVLQDEQCFDMEEAHGPSDRIRKLRQLQRRCSGRSASSLRLCRGRVSVGFRTGQPFLKRELRVLRHEGRSTVGVRANPESFDPSTASARTAHVLLPWLPVTHE